MAAPDSIRTTPRLLRRASWRDVLLRLYAAPRTVVLLLGFSAGLPCRCRARRCRPGCAKRRRHRHYRPVCVCRHPLLRNFLVAGRRRARHVPCLRAGSAGAGLAAALAVPAARRDPAAGLLRSRGIAPFGVASRRCWSRRPQRPRTSSSTPSASKACTKANRPPAWLPMWRPTGSPCWSPTAGALLLVSAFEGYGFDATDGLHARAIS